MRQLDSCDFCGDAAEGVFEVVPASVPDGPVRLALCADCRTTLQTVVDPLLDADWPDSSDGSMSGASAVDDPVDEPGAGSRDAGDDSGVTIEIEDGETDDHADATVAADDATVAADDTANADPGDTAAGCPDTDDGAGTEDADVGGSPARRPDGYAQVVRLLQNRDGAMSREDLRALATNAYDLGEHAFEDAVDAALEAGDVEETDAGLRTT